MWKSERMSEPTLLPLAKRSAAVGGEMVVFEPQPFIFQNLCANLALNGITNVRAWPWACGADAGTVWFARQDYAQPGNFGGVSMQSETTSPDLVPAPWVQLDSVLGESDVTLIKLDVEGFELAALRGALQVLRRSRPTLYVENDRVDNSRELIEWLWAQEYRLWWHICPLFNEDNFRGKSEGLYQNVVAVNMLALPRETGVAQLPLVEVTDAGFHPFAR
ncbi:FkbM family methyltransferase [Caballeronia mineralivorans]|uniref:FkbM family methyltransferase n=1 Tax=Caballeronia mineralivorans TaxID=2010198 RepID=UPI00191001AC|nr:FkbM family methyltransferase [Caballeronia mineralivorans]